MEKSYPFSMGTQVLLMLKALVLHYKISKEFIKLSHAKGKDSFEPLISCRGRGRGAQAEGPSQMPGLPLTPPLRGPRKAKTGAKCRSWDFQHLSPCVSKPRDPATPLPRACSRTNLNQSGKDLWEENDQTLLRDVRKI